MAMNFEELAAEGMNLALEERLNSPAGSYLVSRSLLSRRLRGSGSRRLNGV